MKFAVTIVSSPGYIHSECFREVAETLHYGLTKLGHDSVITTSGNLEGRQHIVLGSNRILASKLDVSPTAILYNLEQVKNNETWIDDPLITLFARHTLWDYSPLNAAAWAEHGLSATSVLPIGYAPVLTRIERSPTPDIDVLFVGSLNNRRKAVIEAMRSRGLRVAWVFGMYGRERDALIARSKVMLNMHFYQAKVLEVVRLSYYLANRCAVLSERSASPDEDAVFDGGVAFADYGDLSDAALELCQDAARRERLTDSGFDIMSRRRIEDYLSPVLTDLKHTPS